MAREWVCSHSEYHAATHILGNSQKDKFRESRREYEQVYVAKSKPAETTTAMRLGQLVHTCVLEYPEWQARYACEPSTFTDGTVIKKAKAAHKAYLEDFRLGCVENNRCSVDSYEHALCEDIRAALMGSNLTRTILEAPGLTEHSLVWHNQNTGLQLKCRRDKVLGGNILVDLKTTVEPVNPDSFSRIATNYGYHRTAAWYLEGHHDWTGETARYVFLLVNKTTHEFGLYEVDSEAITLGHRQNQRALEQLARCYESGDWSGEFAHSVTKVSLPRYAFNQE